MNNSSKKKEPDFEFSILICPSRDSRVESRLDIAAVESIDEFIKVRNTASYFASSNLRMLELLIAYSDQFKTKLSLLTGVPGCDYSAQYEAVTWSLDRIGYDALIVELDADERRAARKKAESPHSASQMGGKDAYRVDVDELKDPTAFDVNKIQIEV